MKSNVHLMNNNNLFRIISTLAAIHSFEELKIYSHPRPQIAGAQGVVLSLSRYFSISLAFQRQSYAAPHIQSYRDAV